MSTPITNPSPTPKYSNKYGIVCALTELATVIFAALHKKGDQNTLKAEKPALIAAAEAKPQTFPILRC